MEEVVKKRMLSLPEVKEMLSKSDSGVDADSKTEDIPEDSE